MPNDQQKWLTFTLDARRYAIPVVIVERVLPAVETTPVPNSPAGLLGLINVEGVLIPVIDLRQMMHQAPQPLQLKNQLVLVKVHARSWAIVADQVGDIMRASDKEIVSMKQLFMEDADYVDGVFKQDTTVIFLLNLKKLLSRHDFHAVEAIVSNGNHPL